MPTTDMAAPGAPPALGLGPATAERRHQPAAGPPCAGAARGEPARPRRRSALSGSARAALPFQKDLEREGRNGAAHRDAPRPVSAARGPPRPP